jgi:hypothetical protein
VQSPAPNSFISLKEAADLSGYSADYIGQLIRAGKIPGKQVYCNVQWMTTPGAIEFYKKHAKEQKNSPMAYNFRKFKMELGIIKLFFTTFKAAVLILLATVATLVVLASFLLFYWLGESSTPAAANVNETAPPTLTF